MLTDQQVKQIEFLSQLKLITEGYQGTYWRERWGVGYEERIETLKGVLKKILEY